MPVLVEELRRQASQDMVVVAPDAGRVKVAERFSQHLNCDLAFVHKRRPRGTTNQVEALDVVGDVEGRHCVLIDDMIDTAGTICAGAELLAERGASDIWAMATHAVLSDPALERLEKAPLSRVVVTDTLPVRRRPPDREAGRPVGVQAHRRRHRRCLRGHVRVGDLRRGQPGLRRERLGRGVPQAPGGRLVRRAVVSAKRSRTSPTVRSRGTASRRGRCSWMW